MANINRYGGTITITASTEPSPPNIVTNSVPDWVTVTSTGESWHATVSENNRADERSGTVRVTINSATSSEYYPNSTATTAEWTVTQAGTGATPGNSIYFIFASTENFGYFTMAVSGSGIYDEQTTEGISDSGDLGNSSIPTSASIYLGVKNGTGGSRQIAMDYTTSSPSYSPSSVAPNSWKWINVTQGSDKSFYVQVW